MQATAKIRTSVAEDMVRPSASSTGGKTRSPSAAINSGIGRRFDISSASLEPRDAFAEQAARPEQQHQQHQKIDRRGRGRRIADADHDAFDEPDQQRRSHDAPERSETAAYHAAERGRNDLLAHRRM